MSRSSSGGMPLKTNLGLLQGPPRSGWRKCFNLQKTQDNPMRSVYTNLNGGNLWRTCQTRGMKNGGSCHTKPKIASFSNWHIPTWMLRKIQTHCPPFCKRLLQFYAILMSLHRFGLEGARNPKNVQASANLATDLQFGHMLQLSPQTSNFCRTDSVDSVAVQLEGDGCQM